MNRLAFPLLALAFATMMVQAAEVRSLGRRVAALEYRLDARQVEAAVKDLGQAHKFSADIAVEKMRVTADAPASGPIKFGK